MIGIADPDQAETDLAAGLPPCPGCAGPLRPWGHARTRTVRDLGRSRLVAQPRRARCHTCPATHGLLPAAVTARHADSTPVIGTAPLASARGSGHRPDRHPARPAAVRRWVRAVRDPAHVQWLRAQGRGWLAQVDHDVLGDVPGRRQPPAGTLDEALTTPAAAAAHRAGPPAAL
jgi:hypothetical protein